MELTSERPGLSEFLSRSICALDRCGGRRASQLLHTRKPGLVDRPENKGGLRACWDRVCLSHEGRWTEYLAWSCFHSVCGNAASGFPYSSLNSTLPHATRPLLIAPVPSKA